MLNVCVARLEIDVVSEPLVELVQAEWHIRGIQMRDIFYDLLCFSPENEQHITGPHEQCPRVIGRCPLRTGEWAGSSGNADSGNAQIQPESQSQAQTTTEPPLLGFELVTYGGKLARAVGLAFILVNELGRKVEVSDPAYCPRWQGLDAQLV